MLSFDIIHSNGYHIYSGDTEGEFLVRSIGCLTLYIFSKMSADLVSFWTWFHCWVLHVAESVVKRATEAFALS